MTARLSVNVIYLISSDSKLKNITKELKLANIQDNVTCHVTFLLANQRTFFKKLPNIQAHYANVDIHPASILKPTLLANSQ